MYEEYLKEYFDGVVIEQVPKRNAVIIEFLESGGRIVSVECVDYKKEKEMKDFAFRLINSNPL